MQLLWCSRELQACCHAVANFVAIYIRDLDIPAIFQSQPSSICWFDLLPCLHLEWSCLEKTQEQSFVQTADWKHVEILMTNMFIPTSFSNETLSCNSTQGPVWESLRKNVFSIPLIASAQYFCPRLPDSLGVCSCIMIYFSHLKPVAKRLLFLDVVVPCLCGVNGTWSHGRWESGRRRDSCPGVCLSRNMKRLISF